MATIGINALFLVPGDVGGTETYFRQNLRYMVNDEQHRFVLFISRDSKKLLQEEVGWRENVDLVTLPFNSSVRPVRIIVEQLLLPLIAWKKRVKALWSPGYTAPLFSSCPQAVTIHDLQYKTHPDDLTLLERVTLDFLVKNSCRRCEAVISVSEFSKTEIIKFGFAKAEKIHAVLEGVDPDFGVAHELKSLTEFGIPENSRFLLCVAHTYPHKKVETLVKAFCLLENEIPHLLVIIGKARRGEEKVQHSIAQMHDRDRLLRLSGLSAADLKTFYQKADVFILPSEYEGFGLPILEAMLSGTSVIATSKASIPEVGGKCAIYVKDNSPESFANAIRNCLSEDVETKRRRLARGKAWAKSFCWAKSAEETLGILINLINKENEKI